LQNFLKRVDERFVEFEAKLIHVSVPFFGSESGNALNFVVLLENLLGVGQGRIVKVCREFAHQTAFKKLIFIFMFLGFLQPILVYLKLTLQLDIPQKYGIGSRVGNNFL